MKKIVNHTIAIFAVIILFAGCSEDWLNEEPPHLITTVTLYTDYSGFQSGINGLYSLVRRDQAIPFAPFMILGTYFVKIL